MPRHRILVVDDEQSIRFGVREYLELRGYDVEDADSCRSAVERFGAAQPDVAVLDYRLPDGDALALMAQLKTIDATVPIIILTAHGSIDLAVRAIKEGAEQFLTKPVELASLEVMLRRLLENRRQRQTQLARRVRDARDAIDPFAGDSSAIRHLAEEAHKVAASDSPVLIQGATGTGKGLIARWLHFQGPRADDAFVDLNCAGLTRDFLESELFGHEKGAFTGAVNRKAGLLEIGHRGTVFLDEIGDIHAEVQPKLLKVLEEKRFRRMGDVHDRVVDIRLIAATHQDLPALIQERRFRSDLYFRISTIPLRVPALRERVEDIPILAARILAQLAREVGRVGVHLSAPAEESLKRYRWPGNIRELRNVLERAVLLGQSERIEPQDLRFDVALTADMDRAERDLPLVEVERRHIEHVLEEEHGHVERAARRLGVPRSTLYQKIRRFGIALVEGRR